MPKIELDVKDTYKSVIRPACMDIIKQMMEHTGIDPETKIQFNDEANHHRTTAEVDFGNGDKITVRATVLYTEEGMLTMSVHRREHPPLFVDNKLGVRLTPLYGDSKINLEVEYRTKDRSTAEMWLNGIKRRVAKRVEERMHAIRYYYLIPNPFLALLTEIHRVRESNEGYGDTLKEYFKEHMDERVRPLANQSGSQVRLAAREQQHNVMGWFNFDTVPELEKGDNASNWISSFGYNVEFERIVSIAAEYPMLVHNKPMSKLFVDWDCDYNVELKDLIGSLTYHNLNTLSPMLGSMSTIEGWAIPCADDWYPKIKRRAMFTAARIMVGVDKDITQPVMNLLELGSYEYNEYVSEYMKVHWDKLRYSGAAAVHVNAHRDQDLLTEEAIRIDEDLNVYFTEEPNCRKQYHIVISIVNDLTILSEEATQWLIDNGDYGQFFIAVLAPHLLEQDKLPNTITVGDQEKLPKKAYWDTIRQIATTHRNYKGRNTIGMLTVANCVIITR